MSSHRGRPASHPTDAHGLVACPGPSSLALPAAGYGRGGRGDGPSRRQREGLPMHVCTSSRVHGGICTWPPAYLVYLRLCSFLPVLEGNRKETQALSQGTHRAPQARSQGLPAGVPQPGTGHTHPDTHTSPGFVHTCACPDMNIHASTHTPLGSNTHVHAHTHALIHTSTRVSSDIGVSAYRF